MSTKKGSAVNTESRGTKRIEIFLQCEKTNRHPRIESLPRGRAILSICCHHAWVANYPDALRRTILYLYIQYSSE